jgi:phage-related holin
MALPRKPMPFQFPNRMMNWFFKMLKTFEYNSFGELLQSMAPSMKYSVTFMTISFSMIAGAIQQLFGLNWLAFLAFLIVLIVELQSGIKASIVKKEPFSSMKLSRFSFKVFYYLVIIAVPFLFEQSYKASGKDFAADIFGWVHVFLVVQIVVENLISIIENISVLDGKPKEHYINKIKEFLSSRF